MSRDGQHLSQYFIDVDKVVYHKARRHGPVIWMALHNKGNWWMDTYNHEPVKAGVPQLEAELSSG